MSARLGQWIDWNRAVVLSRALDARAPSAAEDAPADEEEDVVAACARVRDQQAIAIAGMAVAGTSATGDGANVGYALFHQHYLARQRSMQAATGQLRGRLRDLLARGPADMLRLAEVDAVMESTLSPREQALLARVPGLLGEHFERLRQARASTDMVSPPSSDWLHTFSHDMQAVLLAELDVRFQPIEALLAALRTQTPRTT